MRKFLLKLLTGASLTASVFLFQACYGCPPPDEIYDIPRNVTQVKPTGEGQDVQKPAVDAVETVETEAEAVTPELP